MLQPPPGRFRNDEKLRTSCAQTLELGNAGVAIRRVPPGVRAVVLLREVPPPPARKPEKLVVSLGDHQNRRSWRDGLVDELTHAFDEPDVVRTPPLRVRLPASSPFRFPAFSVGMEKRPV